MTDVKLAEANIKSLEIHIGLKRYSSSSEAYLLYEGKAWIWNKTQNTYYHFYQNFLSPLLFSLWPDIHSIKTKLIYVKLIPLIQAEKEMISIRGIVEDGHIKGTQWCHLGRKRKMENVYSIWFPHVSVAWIRPRNIFMSKRRLGGGWGWVEQRGLSMGTRCHLSRHSGRTF